MLMTAFDCIFRIVSLPVMIAGLMIAAYYGTVVFDDKHTYSGSGRDFIKWIMNMSSTAIENEIERTRDKEEISDDQT